MQVNVSEDLKTLVISRDRLEEDERQEAALGHNLDGEKRR